MNFVIKTGPVEVLNVDELILADAFLSMLTERIAERGNVVPDYLKEETRQVEVALNEKLRSDRERQLEMLRMRRDNLRSREEKAARLDAQISELEGKTGLGGGSTAQGSSPQRVDASPVKGIKGGKR